MLPQERIARLIAFYLPQFHPTPENDEWWGKGFTEWTNVARAKPLFRGHVQPRLPADLGFYDLRVPDVREAQAELARKNGIEGFCYWHYWLGMGKRLLERPFQEVLDSGKPQFPFCLAWANHDWTNRWMISSSEKMLAKQEYPGPQDEIAHFKTVLPAFTDDRYICIKGKPLFMIFYPEGLPDPVRFTDHWRELAEKAGLPGLYFLGVMNFSGNPTEFGFDAATTHPPGDIFRRFPIRFIDKLSFKLTGLDYRTYQSKRGIPKKYDYRTYLESVPFDLPFDRNYFPCILPDWDNTPRYGNKGVLLQGSTPQLFGDHLCRAIETISSRDSEERLIFIKSWNEWAEGNYLEPDQITGMAYLEEIRRIIFGPKI